MLLLEFVRVNLVFDGTNKLFKKTFYDEKKDIDVEMKIIDETEWLINNIHEFPKYPHNYKIYSYYDDLIKEIEKKIYDFDNNDEIYECIQCKINNMEKGIWNLIIIMHKKFKHFFTIKKKEEIQKEDIFVDMQTWDFTELIAELKSENYELKLDYDKLKLDYDKLKLDYDKLKSDCDKLKSDCDKLKSDCDKLKY